MKLSFVIPTLNEALGIEDVLKPLQCFRHVGHEIILADGKSDDDTVELAKSLVDSIVIVEKGRARQQNAGAKEANGDWLFFLHADTQIPKNLQKILGSRLNNDIVWGRFDVKLTGCHIYFRIIEKLMNWRSRLTGIATGDQLIFIRADIFKKIGGFKDIDLMEDIEISTRLKAISAPLCFCETVVTSSKKWEKNGIIKTVLLMWWLRLNFFLGRDPKKLQQIYYPNNG